jgi:hypothetical protein
VILIWVLLSLYPVPATIDFRRYNKNPKVVVSGNLTVLCRVTGVPVPTISWFKNGEDLDVDSLDNVEIDNEGQELTIYSAQVIYLYVYHIKTSQIL